MASARAKRMFAGMFLLIAAVVSLVTSGVQPLRDKEASIVEQIGRTLPSGTIVMLPDSPMYYYHTGNPAINLPNEPPDTLLQVADKFHATYLILDPGYPAPLQGIYDNTSRHPRIHFVADYDGIRLYQLLPP